MICVVEYGEHIGTLRNLFPDSQRLFLLKRLLLYPTVNTDLSDPMSGTVKKKRSMLRSKAWGIEIRAYPDI